MRISETRETLIYVSRRTDLEEERKHNRLHLAGAVSSNHCPRSLHQNLQIEPGRTMPCIPQIEPDHVVKSHATPPLHLPQTCDSRLRFEQSPPMPGRISLDLIRNRRTRPNQRHIAAQHVDELRQFIQARSPQKVSHRSNPRIVGEFENALARAIGRCLAAWPAINWRTYSLCWLASLFTYIERNFRKVNAVPCSPMRC